MLCFCCSMCVGYKLVHTYTGFAFRFIDDNALPVVLPAVESFSKLVSAYTKGSFNTTKEVRLCIYFLLLAFVARQRVCIHFQC